MIGLYFSAHWCGPCRGFTPKLIEKYQAIRGEGHDLEIIFISADEDEEAALSYFKEMPWKMLAFSDRDSEQALSKRFGIRGIPTLILLDEAGQLISKEGREVIMEAAFPTWKSYEAEKAAQAERDAKELADLKESFQVSTFLSKATVVDGEGNALGEGVLKGKMIGLYFSAHWCGPCRGFTPVLAERYSALLAAGHELEIVFISSDRDESSAKEYFADMPWKMLAFSERKAKKLLSELFEVQGIPTLVLLDDSGVITTEGREAIMLPFEDIRGFEEAKKEKAAKLDALIATYPESVQAPQHEHALVKMPHVYRGSYGCDICHSGGAGWVYHCDECGFDAHPHCVVIQDAAAAAGGGAGEQA